MNNNNLVSWPLILANPDELTPRNVQFTLNPFIVAIIILLQQHSKTITHPHVRHPTHLRSSW